MSNRRRLAPVAPYQQQQLPGAVTPLLTPEKLLDLHKAQDTINEVLTNRVSDVIDRVNTLTERWNDLEALTERVAELEAKAATEPRAGRASRAPGEPRQRINVRVVEREQKIVALLARMPAGVPTSTKALATALGESDAVVAGTCTRMVLDGLIARFEMPGRTPHYISVPAVAK
jgi:hypothetical protein